MGDAKRLRLYAQSVVSAQKVLSASLMDAESSSRRWEPEAKEAVERAAQAEAERDAARHEVSMAQLEAEATRSAQAEVE